jgi:hypothetical protein
MMARKVRVFVELEIWQAGDVHHDEIEGCLLLRLGLRDSAAISRDWHFTKAKLIMLVPEGEREHAS